MCSKVMGSAIEHWVSVLGKRCSSLVAWSDQIWSWRNINERTWRKKNSITIGPKQIESTICNSNSPKKKRLTCRWNALLRARIASTQKQKHGKFGFAASYFLRCCQRSIIHACWNLILWIPAITVNCVQKHNLHPTKVFHFPPRCFGEKVFCGQAATRHEKQHHKRSRWPAIQIRSAGNVMGGTGMEYPLVN